MFTVPFPGRVGFVELKDGRFLALNGDSGIISKDRGRTWGDAYRIVTRDGRQIAGGRNSSIIRLASGKLAVQHCRTEDYGSQKALRMFCAASDDEGKTWSEEYPINLPGAKGWPLHDVMLQSKTGRLILPVRACYAGSESERIAGQARGTIHGHEIGVEGHAQYPEIDIAFVYYSDDEGKTWKTSENEILGWPDDGKRGLYATDEPTVAQLPDGRLIMFARSTFGRIAEAWSDNDGRTWTRALPNELCNSYSPARIRAIPGTGHLHCVWNQVTPAEIMGGFRRSRLTSAISRDGAKTWEHFKTLDVADPLDKSPRQKPDPDYYFVVAGRKLGEMPDNYCIYRYPNAHYVGDMAYIDYDRESFTYPGSPARQRVVRVMPIESLYDDSKSDISLPNTPPEDTKAAVGEHIEE